MNLITMISAHHRNKKLYGYELSIMKKLNVHIDNTHGGNVNVYFLRLDLTINKYSSMFW